MATRKKKTKSRAASWRMKKAKQVSALRKRARPDLAEVFQNLSTASGLMFSGDTHFLITEQSAHIFLTRIFSMLGNASRAGKLQQAARAMVNGAAGYRIEMLPELNPLQSVRAQLPVFGEINGERLSKKIQDCINPTVPDALKTSY